MQHIAPSTGHLSYRPEAFLSMVHSVVQVCLYIIRLYHLLRPLLLRTADEKARSRAPTLRKPSPPQGCQVPHRVSIALDVFCTINAVGVLWDEVS